MFAHLEVSMGSRVDMPDGLWPIGKLCTDGVAPTKKRGEFWVTHVDKREGCPALLLEHSFGIF